MSRSCCRPTALFVVLSALHLMAAGPAAACWCRPAPGASVLWPEDGALDVASDTAIVMWRHHGAGDPSLISLSLTGPDGQELELEETRHSSYVWQCSGETVFFQPKQPLVEGSSYVLTSRAGDTPRTTKFGVSATPRKPSSDITPEVTYLSVAADASHKHCHDRTCVDLAEIRVDLGQVPETPVWLFVRSQAAPYQYNEWQFSPDFRMDVAEGEPDTRRTAQLSVHAPKDDPCVEIGVYGVDGRPLFEERRCHPDRCVVYGSRAGSPCDAPPQSQVDASRISTSSCDDPPHLRDSELLELMYPASEADAEPAQQITTQSNSCAVQPPSAASRGPWQLTLALCAWLFVRRRLTSRAHPPRA